MIILIEFLAVCGLAAIVASLLYTGYRAGKSTQKDKDES